MMRASASGETLRVTIRVFREPLGVDLAGVAMVDGSDVAKVGDLRFVWIWRAAVGACGALAPVTGAVRGCQGGTSGGGCVDCHTLSRGIRRWCRGSGGGQR